jgi:hypothetical protein
VNILRPGSLPWREGEKSTIYPSHLLSKEILFQHYAFATYYSFATKENRPLIAIHHKKDLTCVDIF